MRKEIPGIPDAKRRKLNDKPWPESQVEVSLRSTSDLRKLLTFHQDDVRQYIISLQSFRTYLESLASTGAIKDPKDGILFEYLSSTTTNIIGDQIEALPDLLQAWRYATQVYHEGLMIAIPDTLATLLRTISSSSDFIEVGEQICKTIIRKENASILQKSLNSSRLGDKSIARCLDLMTELVSFDGGTCARNVWLQRNITMQQLPQFLAMSKKTIRGLTESLSIRDYAIAFFLANLRYQDQEAKADILSTGRVTQVLLRDILLETSQGDQSQLEKPHIVKKILSSLRDYVLRDDKLYKSAKGYVLTNINLGYILRIMRHDGKGDEWREAHDLAESFLTESCTSQKYGIVFKQHGWYPKGTEDVTIKQDAYNFVSNDRLTYEAKKYKDQVPVRNTTLAQFILDLRPWASVPERKLILKIFEAAPELVADYLLRKKTFSFEPKLTTTWIGWATFLYSILRLPCSSYDVYLDGRIRAPPPMFVVIQSILPQVLTRQVLTKAIKHQSELIRMFTLRILVASFEKMQIVLDTFQDQGNPDVWKTTGRHILKELAQRWPEYKQVFHLYQSFPEEKHVLREISASLLMLYNTVTPQLVSTEKLDISLQLTRLLNRVALDIDTCDASILMELNHLIEIGNCSIETKWWQKPKNSTVSSVNTILRLLATSALSQNARLRSIIRQILGEQYILVPSKDDSLEALLTSLSITEINVSCQQDIFQYLDDCMLRLTHKADFYQDEAENLVSGDKSKSVALLFMVLSEQWFFFLRDHDIDKNMACAKWQSSLLIKAAETGESAPHLQAVCDRFQDLSKDKGIRQTFKDCRTSLEAIETQLSITNSTRDALSNGLDHQSTTFEGQVESVMSILDERLSIPEESLDHPSLIKWAKKDISDAILELDISSLIQYLGSKYHEVRIQATSALRSFLKRVQNSKHEDRNAIYLAVGEILETLQGHKTGTVTSSLAISIAARSVLIVTDPTHDLYTAINQFLGRAPAWDLAKLPSYWTSRIFNKPLGQPNGQKWKAVEWLVDTLIEGLQTQEDVNQYRRTGVFESVMVNCTSTFAPWACYEKMIHLLYRCCLVGGGSTLITRNAGLQFVDTQILMRPKDKALLVALKSKLELELNNEHVRRYLGTNGSIEEDEKEEEDDDSSSWEDESEEGDSSSVEEESLSEEDESSSEED